MPSPGATELRAVASPLPTQTMSGWLDETATAPTETVASLWNDGDQLWPASSVFHNPLGPTAA